MDSLHTNSPRELVNFSKERKTIGVGGEKVKSRRKRPHGAKQSRTCKANSLVYARLAAPNGDDSLACAGMTA